MDSVIYVFEISERQVDRLLSKKKTSKAERDDHPTFPSHNNNNNNKEANRPKTPSYHNQD